MRTNEELAPIFAKIVESLPRTEVKDKKGEFYRGVESNRVFGSFMAVLEQIKHPLFGKKNADCSSAKLCGNCQYDVFIAVSKLAVDGKLVQFKPAGKETVYRDKKTGELKARRNPARFYNYGELQGGSGNSEDYKAIAKLVLG